VRNTNERQKIAKIASGIHSGRKWKTLVTSASGCVLTILSCFLQFWFSSPAKHRIENADHPWCS